MGDDRALPHRSPQGDFAMKRILPAPAWQAPPPRPTLSIPRLSGSSRSVRST